MDEDVLGAPKAWQIKEFPEGLRNRIIAAARDADQSVAEYVTGVMLRHLDGAAATPEPRVNGFANRVNQSDTRFRTAIEMACSIAAHLDKMPKGVASLANRLVKSELEALQPPPKLQPAGLAAAAARRSLAAPTKEDP